MESEQYKTQNVIPNLPLIVGIALLLSATSLGTAALVGQFIESKRMMVAAALLLTLGFIILLVWLKGIKARKIVIIPEAVPLASLGEIDANTKFLELESRVEHAPIALFAVRTDQPEIRPLNGNARRILAPGRSSNTEQLFEQIRSNTSGKRAMILFETEQGLERALLASSDIYLHGEQQTMVALMPVESELQLEAQNAWLKLIHVLTHEIMNSLTPVTSLSRTAQDLLSDCKTQLQTPDFDDLHTALDAIHRRARGLVEFVSSYRSLSNVPTPKPEQVPIHDFLNRLAALSNHQWHQRNGRIIITCEPSNLCAVFDPNQLEQAFINLIKNAEEATAQSEHPELQIHAKLTRGNRLRIEISDNGPGVPEDLIPQIFTPFFSTKERGSGIGLALVRQLIQGNGGTVRYAQRLQGGALFIISL
ncbi:ATP-binding protein [Undibacterium cyanobacteriorum]|uniref:histidine kinase n=1 Tax=Undibacterium cyanobacteriorum TaxID=3073561 RepID=A0ABY9RJN5_9BURK|nr:ATP-binding protein [Undibacterium sp. 20NA77.5]WMW81151.1 ATP-binding protein [Undibacterium sp. 20NA77.5]